jgi:hypothetical protein
MAKQVFVPKVDDLVRSKQLKGVFKVTGVQIRGEKCFIQEFNVVEAGTYGRDVCPCCM